MRVIFFSMMLSVLSVNGAACLLSRAVRMTASRSACGVQQRFLTDASDSDNSSFEKQLEAMQPLLASVDPALKKILRFDRRRCLSALEYDLRNAAAVALLGSDYAQQVLDRTFVDAALGGKSTMALVPHLLHYGAVPKDDHVRIAARKGDCELVRKLLDASFAAGQTPRYPLADLSFEMIKLLLSYPINVSTIKRVWKYESPTAYVVYETLLSRYYKEGVSDEHKLDYAQKQDLLKKVIVLTRAGDPLTFEVNNPVSSKESGNWCDRVDCCNTHGDWTFGRFPDIAIYTRAIIEARHGDDHAKQKAIKTMAAIQAKWKISEDDVTVELKVPNHTGRLQESD